MPFPRSFRALAPLLCALLYPQIHANPVDVTIRTVREQMRFDVKEFKVPVGSRVRLHFQNEDSLPHNVLVCLPREVCEPNASEDNGLEVAQAAWALGAEGPAQQWIPKHPRVFVATSMLDGGRDETIEFDAPARAGRYPFVCTFPGHAMLMFGTMHVQADVAGLRDLRYTMFRTGALKAFPDFDAIRAHPIQSGTLPDGLIDATPVAIADHYAMEFTATLPVAADGDYTFTLAADKGTQLFIDGTLVVDHRTGHSARAIKSGTVPLRAGDRTIVMRYWHQLGDDPEVSLVWSGPGFEENPLSRLNLVERKRQNDGDRLEGMQLRPDREPIVYRNYLADLPHGGFAVGFPGGANFSWNPETCSVSSLWAGDFLDVKAHRVSRGIGAIKPAGFDVVRLPPIPGFLEDTSAPTQPEVRFLGHRFDAQRAPVFRYRFRDSIVEESWTSSGEVTKDNLVLTRTVHLKNPGRATSELWLRLAAHRRLSLTPEGLSLDERIRVTVSGGEIELRDERGTPQADVRVPIRDGRAALTVEYRWLSTSAKAAAAHAH